MKASWKLTALASVAIAAAGYGVASAASSSVSLSAGDRVRVTCGGSGLARTVNSANDWTVRCKGTPSPSTSSPAPTPSTSISPSTTPAPSTSTASGGWDCVTTSPSGNCGGYDYPGITNSNGYNTYVGNDCWADPNCKQTLSVNNPGDWQLVANQADTSGAVRSYPNIQQLMNDWCGTGWNCGANNDTPVSALSSLTSTYTESTPHGPGTITQFAWDIWVGNAGTNSDEIMVWVDNVGRGDGGATYVKTYTVNGQPWSLYFYGGPSGETILMPGQQGEFQQNPAGTVDLLALLKALIADGYQSPDMALGQIDAGWEICSTGGQPETFTVSQYTLTAAA